MRAAARPAAPCARAQCARPRVRRAALPARAMAADAPKQLWCGGCCSCARAARRTAHAGAPRRGGRFSEKIDPLMEKFNESLSTDKRMAQEVRRARAARALIHPALTAAAAAAAAAAGRPRQPGVRARAVRGGAADGRGA
jgi:hypothetical protein